MPIFKSSFQLKDLRNPIFLFQFNFVLNSDTIIWVLVKANILNVDFLDIQIYFPCQKLNVS